MAIDLTSVLEEVKAVITMETGADPEERCDKIFSVVANFLLQTVARDVARGQVSILMSLPEGDHLTFAYPKHLSRGNLIPVDRNSIAGRTLMRRSVFVKNDIPREPHKDFYERLRDREGNVRTIQKMVAAPIITPSGDAIGVVEVSRTGESAEKAGPDFVDQDGETLRRACRLFAPYLSQTWVSRNEAKA